MNYRDTTKEGPSLWSVDAIEDMAFIQAANKEAFGNAILSQIGNAYDPTKVYILFGCVNLATPLPFTISAGAVFYSGEIFTVDAVSFTASGTAVATLSDTSDGDMRLFSDGSTKAVTRINKIVIGDAVSGSGIADYADFVRLNLSYADEVQTDVSNGQTLEVNVLSGAPFTYANLVTSFSYRLNGKRCELDFNVNFDVTDGALIDQIQIPLPTGIVKNTTLDKKYSARGFCALIAPAATTDYDACYVNAIDDGTEGQRLVIRSMVTTPSAEMTINTGCNVTLKGHIDFQVV